jgi:oleandomycin transport system ATP-binding protein
VTGDAALAELVAALVRAGVEVTELALHLPSLDEVFLSLTGAPTRNAHEDIHARAQELV